MKRDPARAAKFEQLLLDITNPKAANFGKWLSKEDVIQMVSPDSEAVDSVMKFLQSFGRNKLPTSSAFSKPFPQA